jgi:transcription termination factor Rho
LAKHRPGSQSRGPSSNKSASSGSGSRRPKRGGSGQSGQQNRSGKSGQGSKQGHGGKHGQGNKQGQGNRSGQRRNQSQQGGNRRHGQGGHGGGAQRQNNRSSAPVIPPQKAGPALGVLELTERGDGQLRDAKKNFTRKPIDPYVSADMVTQIGLRGGELIAGEVVENGSSAKLEIETINEIPLAKWQSPPTLDETTAIDPVQAIQFSTPGGPISMRMLELFTPIGFGQRALIVAPPRTGKTVLLQQMAAGIAQNHPDAYMVVLLIDERPEEVTEMRRNVHGEVFASSNDHEPAAHVRMARLVIERARRMVEGGGHIIVLLDSITRLARAFNHEVGSSGRTMTGGLDIKALVEPKQIFGSARCVEDGGSLTIIGTALIETGSRADEFIFQEFKGTGNMELVLSRELANLRIWPAMDLQQSGTRKEEKLLDEATLNKVNMIRRQLHGQSPTNQVEMLVERMGKFDDLAGFLKSLRDT